MKKINPSLDRLLKKIKSKISTKVLKGITLAIIIFIATDCLLTCYAQQKFITRMIIEYHIEVEDREDVLEDYNRTYGNDALDRIIRTLWSDKKMIKTFPNIKIEDKSGNTIYLDSLLPDIQPYYLKIFDK